MIEHKERERSRLRQTTINSYDIVLRVIERGFIRGTLTIENVPRITRGGTKRAMDQRRKNGGRDGQIEKAHERTMGALYSRVFVVASRGQVRVRIECAYRRWWYGRCINGYPLIDINDRCISFLISVVQSDTCIFF